MNFFENAHQKLQGVHAVQGLGLSFEEKVAANDLD